MAASALSSAGLVASSAGAAGPTYQAAHAGGTLKLLATEAGGTLDPQVNYTLQYWQLYQATYDGLVDVPEGRRHAVLRRRARPRDRDAQGLQRRARPTPSRLRKGIKFSNGNTVTVNDVLATFQRLFKVSNPNAGIVVQRHRRWTGVRHDARDVHVHGWRRGERRDQLGRRST